MVILFTEPYELVGLIFVLSLVQSVFGIGILVFGTPTLLLAGYSFAETLALLLPASLMISAAQVLEARDKLFMSRGLVIYTLPMVGIGLWIIISGLVDVDIRLLVGVMMLLAGGLRFSVAMQRIARQQIITNSRLYLILMGIVHGVTNMGGALLTIFMATLYEKKDKLVVRTNIANGYLLFGLVQIAVLLIVEKETFTTHTPLMMVTALLAYLFIGKQIFRRLSNDLFRDLLTLFIFAYGVALLGQVIHANLS